MIHDTFLKEYLKKHDKAGKLPCEMLEMPKNQLACQVTSRIRSIFDYVSARCDSNWNNHYGALMDELEAAAAPVDGSDCPSVDLDALYGPAGSYKF